MAALQAGQDASLALLMERWELGVKAFLLRLGVPVSDVEDVAQEAFVRLYEKRASYRAGAPFKPWLLTLAGNLGRNRLRWRFRRREDSMAVSNRPIHRPIPRRFWRKNLTLCKAYALPLRRCPPICVRRWCAWSSRNSVITKPRRLWVAQRKRLRHGSTVHVNYSEPLARSYSRKSELTEGGRDGERFMGSATAGLANCNRGR